MACLDLHLKFCIWSEVYILPNIGWYRSAQQVVIQMPIMQKDVIQNVGDLSRMKMWWKGEFLTVSGDEGAQRSWQEWNR